MNKYPQADTAGIFRKLLTEDWLVESYAGGMPYMKKGVLLRSSPSEPIYSYGHNYTKFGHDFSLFVWTTESDKDKISKYFDDVVQGLTKEQIEKINTERFSYVDRKYNGVP